jgi:hypothetical protein
MDNDDIEDVPLDLGIEARQPKPAGDLEPAAQALARLEGEMALMRRAVQHLAAERADIVIPHYTPTLGQMAGKLDEVSHALGDISTKPAIKLTPETIYGQITNAARDARTVERRHWDDARGDFKRAAGQLDGLVSRVRTSTEQQRRIVQDAAAGLVAGLLLWSILPSAVARSAPASWHWPEWMARRAMGEESAIDAAIRLIRSRSEETWDEIAKAAKLMDANREARERCEKRAGKTKAKVRCEVEVDAPRPF